VKTIALFVQHPKCSVQSCNGIIKALGPNYTYKIFTKHENEDDFFDDVDLVIFPGGIGDSDSWDIYFQSHRSKLRKYIENGGRYLGISKQKNIGMINLIYINIGIKVDTINY